MTIKIVPMGKPRINRAFWTNTAQRYFAWRDAVKRKLGDFELPEVLIVTFYIPMPRSWSMAKRMEMLGAPHQQKPDVDNLIKALADCWPEDKHVWRVEAEKRWSLEGIIELE